MKIFLFFFGVSCNQQHQEALEGDLSEIPVKQRRSLARPLDDCLKQSQTRNMAMYEAYRSGAYTLKEIAQHFKMHYSTVSRVVAKCKT